MFRNRGWAARAVVESFANPERYSSPTAYLEDLTRHLDKLCRAYGMKPPEDIYEAFGLEGAGGTGEVTSVLSEPSESEEEALRYEASA